jgi:hypothetical protein
MVGVDGGVLGVDRHGDNGRGVLAGVVEQVGERLGEVVRCAVDEDLSAHAGRGDGEIGANAADAVGFVVEERAEVDGRSGLRGVVLVEAGKGQESVDEPGGSLAFATGAIKQFGVAGVVGVRAEEVDRDAQAGEGCAELVGGVGGEAASGVDLLAELVFGAAEVVDHGVDGGGEATDLGGGVVGCEPLLAVAAADRSGVVDYDVDGLEGSSGGVAGGEDDAGERSGGDGGFDEQKPAERLVDTGAQNEDGGGGAVGKLDAVGGEVGGVGIGAGGGEVPRDPWEAWCGAGDGAVGGDDGGAYADGFEPFGEVFASEVLGEGGGEGDAGVEGVVDLFFEELAVEEEGGGFDDEQRDGGDGEGAGGDSLA